VNARPIRLASTVLAIAALIVLVPACGSSATSAGGSSTGSADSGEPDALYARIDQALDDAYAELGKPPVNWDNMERVKDRAFEALTSESAEPTWGASWSVSVLDDHVAIYVNVEGAEKSGDWRP
jgi:hypothetical protein